MDAPIGFDHFQSIMDDRQVSKAQKVHFQKSQLFDLVLFILGLDKSILGELDRHVIIDGLGADHHPRRMGAGIPGKSLQVQAVVDEAVDLGIGLIELPEFRTAVQCLLQGHPRTTGHHLGDLIHIPEGHIRDPAHVPDHRPGRQGTEGNNLGHLVFPVFPGQVIDDFPPSPVTDIRINIRHGHTLGVQEPFKEEVKPERIDFRNVEQVRHDGAGSAATARSDRDTVGFRIMDEIHDDEEIIGKSHVLNDAQFIVQPLLFLPRGVGIPLRQGGLAEFPEIGLRRLSLRHVKGRKFMVPECKSHLAAVRYFFRIFNGSRILAQDFFHFPAALAVKFIVCKVEMVGIIQGLSRGNTELDFLASGVFLLRIVEIVGGHEAEAVFLRQLRQHRPHRRFFREAMVLELDEIIILSEGVDIELNHLPGFIHVPVQDSLGQFSSHAGRHGNEAFMVLPEQVMVRPGFEIIALGPGLGADFDKVLVALIIFRQQDEMGQFFLLPAGFLLKTAPPGHINFAADDGLDSLGHAFLVQVHSAVHDTVVRDGNGGLPHFFHVGHELLNPAGPIEEAVFCMGMKMNEWIHCSSC